MCAWEKKGHDSSRRDRCWALAQRWDEIEGSWSSGGGGKWGGLTGDGVRGRKGGGQIRLNNRRCQSGETSGETYDFKPAFSRVSSSRLLDLLTVCRTWSTTSEPWRPTRIKDRKVNRIVTRTGAKTVQAMPIHLHIYTYMILIRTFSGWKACIVVELMTVKEQLTIGLCYINKTPAGKLALTKWRQHTETVPSSAPHTPKEKDRDHFSTFHLWQSCCCFFSAALIKRNTELKQQNNNLGLLTVSWVENHLMPFINIRQCNTTGKIDTAQTSYSTMCNYSVILFFSVTRDATSLKLGRKYPLPRWRHILM